MQSFEYLFSAMEFRPACKCAVNQLHAWITCSGVFGLRCSRYYGSSGLRNNRHSLSSVWNGYALSLHQQAISRSQSSDVRETEQAENEPSSSVNFATGPKNMLQNLTQVLGNKGQPSMGIRFTHKYDALTKKWEAQLKMVDSTMGANETRIYRGTHARKSTAEANAALAAVAFLIDKGILDRRGKVVVGGKEERRQKLLERRALPVDLMLTKKQLNLMERFLEEYTNLLPPASEVDVDDNRAVPKLLDADDSPASEKLVHILTGDNFEPLPPDRRASLNNQLYDDFYQRTQHKASIDEQRFNLPLFSFRDKLLRMIEQNQVLIVAGETGSGKSTQLPQYILDQYIQQSSGADCGIVVTQPRRISALSLSERVAFERDEPLGESVGYQVRLDQCMPRLKGFIFYCTTATMVNMLRGVASSSRCIRGLTHLIIDEVHVRDAHIDILLTGIKLMLKTDPNLRVVLMSASMDHALLSKYFDNCPVIDIPGRAFPVTERFLPDVMRQIGSYSPGDIESMSEKLQQDPGYLLQTDLVLQTIEMIEKHRPPGAVLCFLPGWQEIQMLNKALCASKWFNSGRHVIHRLHSKIPLAEQRKVFNGARANQRKIILATNVAESSITVDDVRYVVDTGLHRDTFFDPDRNTTCLKLERTAKANTVQRKGRAGRVAAGECFLLFSKETHDNALDFPVPEVKRMPLETVCLESKLLAPDVLMPVAEFVRRMPEPPVAADVEQAVQRLVELGVFTRAAVMPSNTLEADADVATANSNKVSEQLTDLGRRIAHFTSHPRMSIALLYSRLLRCTGTLVSVASMYTSTRDPFLSNIDEGRETVRHRKRHLAKDCDWQAIARLMRLYGECRGDEYAVEQFCRRYQLDPDALKFIDGSRAIFLKHLSDACLLDDMYEVERQEEAAADDEIARTSAPLSVMRAISMNENELSNVFVRAAVCVGYGDQLGKILGADLSGGSRQSERRRVFMLDEGRTGELASQSAVDPVSLPEQSLIVYANKRVYERDRRHRAVVMGDATHVHPLHVLLFTRRLTPEIGADSIHGENEHAVITFAELPFLKMRCSTRHEAEVLLQLRTAVHRVVEHAISATELRGEVLQLLTQLRRIVACCIPEN